MHLDLFLIRKQDARRISHSKPQKGKGSHEYANGTPTGRRANDDETTDLDYNSAIPSLARPREKFPVAGSIRILSTSILFLGGTLIVAFGKSEVVAAGGITMVAAAFACLVQLVIAMSHPR